MIVQKGNVKPNQRQSFRTVHSWTLIPKHPPAFGWTDGGVCLNWTETGTGGRASAPRVDDGIYQTMKPGPRGGGVLKSYWTQQRA